MTANPSSPVAVLATHEHQLNAGILKLAERVDGIATVTTADALDRLRRSVEAAKDRLHGAYMQVQAMATSLIEDFATLTSTLMMDLAANDLPAPVTSQTTVEELPPLGVAANPAGNVRVEESSSQATASTNGAADTSHPDVPCEHIRKTWMGADRNQGGAWFACDDCGKTFRGTIKLPLESGNDSPATNLDTTPSVPQNGNGNAVYIGNEHEWDGVPINYSPTTPTVEEVSVVVGGNGVVEGETPTVVGGTPKKKATRTRRKR